MAAIATSHSSSNDAPTNAKCLRTREIIMKIRPRHIVSGFTASLGQRVTLSLLVLLGSWAGSSQAATYTIYTDQTAWAAAVQSHYFLASIVTTSGLSGGGPPSIYYYGQYPLPYLQNSSSAPLGTAFGGNFDLTPGGNGGGLAFLINFADSTNVVAWSAVNYPSGFWGIISDTTIDSVQYFSNDFTGNGETFNYDLLTLQFPVFHIICCRLR
jgi:hypothetical protein